MSPDRTVRAVIGGRVQGVGYRAWTQSEARRRGLSGTVRNRRDGSVEAVFSGAPASVEAVLEACRKGPPGARVDAVAISDVGPESVTSGVFDILPTT